MRRIDRRLHIWRLKCVHAALCCALGNGRWGLIKSERLRRAIALVILDYVNGLIAIVHRPFREAT